MLSLNEEAIDSAIGEILSSFNKDDNIHNTISPIHPQLNFYYNSFNVCVGKQGVGKTTFLMKELIKLSQIPDTQYNQIIYITAGGGEDQTFEKLKRMIKIPIYGLSFENSVKELSQFFSTRKDTTHHTFLIIEDASFLLLKDSPIWTEWICKLRHLRLTIWVNLHVWRSISTMLKTQISSVFVFKGFSKEQLQQISRQSAAAADFKVIYYLYIQMGEKQILNINNINSKVELLN